jgi:hypothetical protein
MAQTTLTLAKALKLKNRLAGRLAKVQIEIQQYNSVLEGAEQPPIKRLAEEREQLVALLIDLKAAISQANAKIQHLIFELAESKASIEFYQRINTRHGKEGMYHGTDKPIVYVAVLRKEDIDAKVAALEQKIDEIQDRLDQYNQTTRIDIDANIFAAVGLKQPPAPAGR